MKTSPILRALLALATTAAVSHAATAVPFHDSFDGGLINWTTTGDVAVQSGSAVLTTAYTTEQDDFPLAAGALNLSGNPTVMAGGDLELFSGLAAGALDLDSLSQATEGSAMKATFTAGAGTMLSFDWQITTRDAAAGADYAFITINGALINLASASSATAAATGDYFTQTGVAHFEYVFQNGGDYTVTFGVVDVGDYSGTTALHLDNVNLAVPEAGSSLLAIAGLSLATLRRKRQD